MGDYRRLKVYEKAYSTAKEMYLLAKRFPNDERYELTSQIKRAATSVPLNIAEGYGKSASENEMLRFLRIAKGSVAETEVLLDFSCDFGYITKEEHEKYRGQYAEIGKMLSGLMESLRRRRTDA